VFRLAPSGRGWNETVIHSFSSSDGEYPEDHDGLLMCPDGALYGTTAQGRAPDRFAPEAHLLQARECPESMPGTGAQFGR
jgi:hypothetical protein